MTTSVLSDSTMLLSTPEDILVSHQQSPEPTTQISGEESESVTCDCCGLTEECTQSYIDAIKECYTGKWICGLCSEAVKYEVIRAKKRLLTTEEAMAKHMKMCNKFKSLSPPPNPTGHLISAMRQILKRSLDSPRMLRSLPNSPSKDEDCSNVLSRSDSCFASLT